MEKEFDDFTPTDLKNFRHQLGMTKTKFAKLLNYSKGRIADIENKKEPITTRLIRELKRNFPSTQR